MRYGLVKKPTVDKNGRHTHVWVRVNKERVNSVSSSDVDKVAKRLVAKNKLLEVQIKEEYKNENPEKVFKKVVAKKRELLSGKGKDLVALEMYNKYLSTVKMVGEKTQLTGKPQLLEAVKQIGFPEEFWFMGDLTDVILTTPFKVNKDGSDGSYFAASENLAVVKEGATPKITKRTVAHELGHAHHYKMGLIDDGWRKKSHARLVQEGFDITREELKHKKFKKYMTRTVTTDYPHTQDLGDYYIKVNGRMTLDISRFTKMLAKDADVKIKPRNRESLEDYALATLDVMMAVDPRYGFGHSPEYYIGDVIATVKGGALDKNRLMEWYAHSSEHTFTEENPFINKLFPKTASRWKSMWSDTLKYQGTLKQQYEQAV